MGKGLRLPSPRRLPKVLSSYLPTYRPVNCHLSQSLELPPHIVLHIPLLRVLPGVACKM